jgi:hypothetical protein
VAALEHAPEADQRCFALQPEAGGTGAVPAARGLAVAGQVLVAVGSQFAGVILLPPYRQLPGSCVPEQPGDLDGPLPRGARSGLLGCWLVGEREDPAVERLGFHEPQRQPGSPAVKEALAAAKDDREQQQPQLVDQALVE